MPKVTVAHLTSVHSTFDTRIFKKQCRTLAAAGYDVVLIAQHDRDEIVDGVRIRHVPKAKGRFQRMFGTAWAVAKIARSENPVICHLHDPELMAVIFWLRLGGVKVVFDMHEDLPKALLTKIWLKSSLRRPAMRIMSVVERILLRRIPVIFAEFSYSTDRAWANVSTTVLNTPLVSELLNIKAEKHSMFSMCYLGGVSNDRGAMIMLDALADLEKQGRSLQFDCMGPIPEQEKNSLLARKREIELPITMDGVRVPADEVWARAARCHVGLAVLSGSPNHRESYPTKMFEYMALGLPVIVSDFPLYREVVDSAQCGICVEPNAKAVSEALAWMMDHPEEAKAMGERGQKAVSERYNWKHEGDKLLAFYDNLLPSSLRDAAAVPGQ